MPGESRESTYEYRMPEMTAAERYAYKSLPENLRRRKENLDDTIANILEFLALLKEFGVELVDLGYADYSPEGSGTFDPAHVAQREQALGQEFAGELQALQSFDLVQHEEIRRDVGRLGKDFVKKVTALQQLMESLFARYNQVILPFTRSKGPDLAKFEKEIRQRISDVSYLTHQHAELLAATQDAIAGDREEMNGEVVDEYMAAVMPHVDAYEALREEYGTVSRLSFRKRKELLAQLNQHADAIRALNDAYAQFTFIDFIAFELPQGEN